MEDVGAVSSAVGPRFLSDHSRRTLSIALIVVPDGARAALGRFRRVVV
jgi:hypothetical protein